MREAVWVVAVLFIAAMLLAGLAVRDTFRELQNQPRTPSVRSVPFIWITATDGWDHAVSDDEVAAGYSTGGGTYRARCSTAFQPEPMEHAPCPPCSGCLSSVCTEHQSTATRDKP